MERHSSRAVAATEGPATKEELPLRLGFERAPLRRAVVEIFDATQQAATEHGWRAATDTMGRRLRDARALHSSERRFVSDALHQLVRGLRRLRALTALQRPTAEQLYLTWLLDRFLEDDQGPPAALLREAERCGLSPPALAERRGALSPPLKPERLGEALSYPDWLVQALLTEYGPERAEQVLRAQNERAPLTVRANLLRGPRAALQAALREEGVDSSPTPLSPWGLHLHTRVNVYGLAAFQGGWMELQDEGSQLIAELVAPPPGGTVVDACAGAGGKTLALGAMMGNKGRILAMDIDPHKLRELQRRSRRAGLTNVQARPGDSTGAGAGPPRELSPRGAARVLVDAPCSGLGVLRRNPEARWRMTRKDVEEIKARQRAILASCAQMVQPHGRLIYATCTILREENDEVIEAFLQAHPDFVQVPAKEILGGARAALLGDGQCLRTLPLGVGGPDGFFAAVLRRAD